MANSNEISRASFYRRFDHHSFHCAFGVASTGRRAWRKEAIDGLKLFLTQFDINGFNILLQILDPFRARNGNDAFALGENPGQRKLRRCATLLCCELLNVFGETLVALKILALKTGVSFAEIGFFEILRAAEGAGQESATERTVGDEADAEFPANCKDRLFRIACPKRVLTLVSRYGMNLVGATHGFGSGFRESEVAHLAGLHQLPHGTDGVFDGNLIIDTVLVVEIDGLDSQPFEAGIAGGAHILRTSINSGKSAV